MMKLKFKTQAYQTAAVQAVVQLYSDEIGLRNSTQLGMDSRFRGNDND
jgi:hypothetical protein